MANGLSVYRLRLQCGNLLETTYQQLYILKNDKVKSISHLQMYTAATSTVIPSSIFYYASTSGHYALKETKKICN